jgi:hypothetical protein
MKIKAKINEQRKIIEPKLDDAEIITRQPLNIKYNPIMIRNKA